MGNTPSLIADENIIQQAVSMAQSGNKVTELNMSNKDLKELRSEIQDLVCLTSLILRNNYLTHLPQELGTLTTLVTLDLSFNHLSEFPLPLVTLRHLKGLDLSHNQISSIPEFVGKMTKLQILDLSHNVDIEEVPAGLSGLVDLSHLFLSETSVSMLPVEMSRNCKKIQQILITRESLIDERFQQEQLDPGNDSMVGLPSLKELAARAVLSNGINVHNACASKEIISYVSNARVCSDCRGPFFQTFYERTQWALFGGTRLKLRHQLCTPHWNTSEERIQRMFQTKRCPILIENRLNNKFMQSSLGEARMIINPNLPNDSQASCSSKKTGKSCHAFIQNLSARYNISLGSTCRIRLIENEISSMQHLAFLNEEELVVNIGIAEKNTLNAIKNVLNLGSERKAEGKVHIANELAPICMECGVEFWITRRKHHCKKCGAVICSRCCMKLKSEKICGFCLTSDLS